MTVGVKTDKQIMMMMRETMILMEMIMSGVTVRTCPQHVTHNVPYSASRNL